MKQAIIALLSTLMFFSGRTASGISKNNPGMDVLQWRDQHFSKGVLPPFSFVLDGISSEKFLLQWQYKYDKETSPDPLVEKTTVAYTDPRSGMQVRCFITCFKEFNTIEWVLKFTNTAGKDSPLLEKAAVINQQFRAEEEGSYTLHHNKGSNAERADFQPFDELLVKGRNVYLTPSGGRSSDNTSFPFFNIEMPGNNGMVVAVGWTGKWYADILQTSLKTVQLKSGMEKMQLSLHSGEEIRTPKICLLFWTGDDRMTGHNKFRQFILAHHSRKIDGHFAEYPLSGSFDYGDPAPCGEYNCLTADYAIALVKRYQHFKVVPELFWLDAGWYTGCGWDKEKGEWWQNVGNWSVDKERFPNGLKPVSDAVHAAGARFMVWFEPERVRPGTQIDKEHPDWLLKINDRDDYLFNLGNREARIWLTDLISGIISKEGIDYYRQDFNFDPMPYWDTTNQPGRVGMAEIRHIEGLYAFWDSLLVRFPKLLIDNCASGGRRIDLETTTRSAPLWRTDYQYGEPNGYQAHTYGLNFYLPIHGTAIYKTDSYTFLSGLGGTAVMNWEVTGRDSDPIPAIQKRIRDYLALRPYFYGDYYPLTGSRTTTRDNAWLAYQLNRPGQGDGIIVAFRRKDSGEETIRIKPGGLEKNARYTVSLEDYGVRFEKTGQELSDGLDISIPLRPASLLIRYNKQ